MTVLGPIPAEQAGLTLPHEHIMVDFIGAAKTGYHRWDRKEVATKAKPFLEEAQALGCVTLMECTPAYVGRDPWVLKALAEQTGLNIVTNTGLYGARKNQFIPEEAKAKSAQQLATEWIKEFENGIEDSGVRPGFIKIAVDAEAQLSPFHKTLVRAAGLTHQATGLVIMSHTGPDAPAFNQLAVLKEMGVSASAFIWTHAQAGTFDSWVRAAKLGAWVSIDNIRPHTFQDHADNLSKLKEAGVLDRILLSHDSGWYRVGKPNGGKYNGYATLFESFIPALKERGFTDSEIEQLLVKNPAKAFAIQLAATYR